MAQWDSIAGMESLRREIDRAFEKFGASTGLSLRTAFLPGKAARNYPLVNLHEDKDSLYIEALAPGVDLKSLDITVVRNELTLSGEKLAVIKDVKPEAVHRSERAVGRFVRTVHLPAEVDENKISADYKNGLLVVGLPKAEKAKPKQINVRVA